MPALSALAVAALALLLPRSAGEKSAVAADGRTSSSSSVAVRFPFGAPHPPCPFPSSLGITALSAKLVPLFPDGRLREAHACTELMLEDALDDPTAVGEANLEALRLNFGITRDILAPRFTTATSRVGRIYHNQASMGSHFPHSSLPLAAPPPRDPAIHVEDNMLTRDQCAALVALWERYPHYEGNILSTGGVISVNATVKKAREYDVSGSVTDHPEWAPVDHLLLEVTYKAVARYENINHVLRTWKSPLYDEGFRIKRYVNDGTEHHSYHADSSPGSPSGLRLIAVLIYLNDVEEGGETVFYSQGVSIKPRCGRVLLFPTAFSYVHAGRPPISGYKYVAANFITM